MDDGQAVAALCMGDDRNLTSHTYNEVLARELMARTAEKHKRLYSTPRLRGPKFTTRLTARSLANGLVGMVFDPLDDLGFERGAVVGGARQASELELHMRVLAKLLHHGGA